MVKHDKQIIGACERACQIENIMSRSRQRDVITARQMCWKIMYERLGYTLQKIGNIFGKHHSTIINGLQTINQLLEVKDPVAVMRWNYLIDDDGVQVILYGQDRRVCLLVPSFVTSEDLLAHLRTRFPDCQIV